MKKNPILELIIKIFSNIPLFGEVVLQVINTLNQETPLDEELIHSKLDHIEDNNEIHKSSDSNLQKVDPKRSPDNDGFNEARNIALEEVRIGFHSNRERMNNKINQLNNKDSLLFYSIWICGIITIGLIALGIYLLIKTDRNLIAIITEIIALISGSGTLIFRNLRKRTLSQLKILEKKIEDNNKYLQMINNTFLLEGEDRNKEIIKTINWLRSNS